MELSEEEREVAQRCYTMAYFVLPRFVFEQPDDLAERISEGKEGAMFLWFVTHQFIGKEVDQETMFKFSAASGDLNDDYAYYIIQYPEPVPMNIDLENTPDIEQVLSKVILAPYFSAMVRNKLTWEARYFVLEQEFDGGTNFRTVTPEINANLGPGCAPELNAFVHFLRERTTTEEPQPMRAMQTWNLDGERQNALPETPAKKWWQFWR